MLEELKGSADSIEHKSEQTQMSLNPSSHWHTTHSFEAFGRKYQKSPIKSNQSRYSSTWWKASSYKFIQLLVCWTDWISVRPVE